MTAVSAWRRGRLTPTSTLFSGGSGNALFQGGDLASLANGYAVAASNGAGAAAPIVNDTYDQSGEAYGDQLCRLAVKLTLSSVTLGQGALLYLWLATLGLDGTTYGDGNFPIGASYGTQQAFYPGWNPVGVLPVTYTGAAVTVVAGCIDFWLPPGIHLPILGNALVNSGGSGVTLSSTAANNLAEFASYNNQNDAAS